MVEPRSGINIEFILLRESSTGAVSVIMSSGLWEGEILLGKPWEVAEEGRARGDKTAADTVIFPQCFTSDPGVFAAQGP